jgi:hypothetical protein
MLRYKIRVTDAFKQQSTAGFSGLHGKQPFDFSAEITLKPWKVRILTIGSTMLSLATGSATEAP